MINPINNPCICEGSFFERRKNGYCTSISNNTKKNYYKIIPATSTCCPSCNSTLIVRDSRRRIVKDSDGNSFPFNLRRLYCPICQELHTEIPDIMTANKHYSKKTIDLILTGECNYYAVDDSTVSRWKKAQ